MNSENQATLINCIKYLESVTALYPTGVLKSSNAPKVAVPERKLIFVAKQLEPQDLELYQAILKQGLKIEPAAGEIIDLNQDQKSLTKHLEQLKITPEKIKAIIFLGLEARECGAPTISLPGLAEVRANAKVKKEFWANLKKFVDAL